jgi:hypothetical protein
MAKGDHLYVKRNGYTHHGIDCGDGYVIEYGGDVKGAIYGKNKIQKVPIKDFSDGKKHHIKNYESKTNSGELAVSKAKSRLGERDYSLSSNNCEHFATWCKTNTHKSDQVDDTVGVIGGCGILLAAAGALAVGAALYVELENEEKRQKLK